MIIIIIVLRIFGGLWKSLNKNEICYKMLKTTFERFLNFFKPLEVFGCLQKISETVAKCLKQPSIF